MTVKFSCVVDQDPKFARQALVWAASLLTYGGEEAESVVVHTVGESHADCLQVLRGWGIETPVVQPFDERHANSNKLAQLESEALYSADYVVLCDCDIAFCQDISPWIMGDAIRARIASFAGLPHRQWEKVFRMAELSLPAARVKAVLNGLDTLPTYCNGGIYILPQSLLQKLREVWPRWDRWLLDRRDLIRPFDAFADQISFAMSCEELHLSVDHLPLELNFDGVSRPRGLHRVVGKTEIQPLVVHYHELDAKGLLRFTQIPAVNREIRKINDLIRLARRVNFHKPSLLLLGTKRSVSHDATKPNSAEAH